MLLEFGFILLAASGWGGQDKNQAAGLNESSESFLPRIKVAAKYFMVGGQRIWINGVNTPWNSWNEFGHNFAVDWWKNHFKTLVESGVNSLNVWVSCDGSNNSPGIDSAGKVLPPTAGFWADVDVLFALARQNKIYLMITLISFDHSKLGSPNSEAWRKMYEDQGNRISFVENYVAPFMRRYQENPYFFAVNVGSELEWVWEEQGVEKNNVLDLIARTANAVHQNSEVLVCQGLGAGVKYNSPDFAGNLFADGILGKFQTGAQVDFYNIHYYSWQNQWFGNPFTKTPGAYGMDDKPCLIGEYPAKGTSGFSPYDCLSRSFANGWQGVMVWSANGVDKNGSLKDFKDAFIRFYDIHKELVHPF